MPFPDGFGAISIALEQIRNRGLIDIHSGLRKRPIDRCSMTSLRVSAGEHSTAGSRTDRMPGATVRETHASRGELIQVGRRKLRTVTVKVSITQIVADHQNYVLRSRVAHLSC